MLSVIRPLFRVDHRYLSSPVPVPFPCACVADCSTAITNGGAPIAASLCNMACAGNSTELCGGPNALNVSTVLLFPSRDLIVSVQVYNYTGTITGTPGVPPGGGGDPGTGPVLVNPVKSGLPNNFTYAACYV